MKLNQNNIDNANLIMAVSNDGVNINKTHIKQSCIISNEHIILDLNLNSIEDLTIQHVDQLFSSNPEIIIMGSGDQHIFPPIELLTPIDNQNIGFEVMNNKSAARTYNILIAEERKVACLLVISPDI
jgi:uncharacterized protein